MKKILGILMGVYAWLYALSVNAADKFDILPDLPEPLAAAQASSVTNVQDSALISGSQSIGQEPSIISVIFSLLIVILLIYATGIIYTKLNKVNAKTMRRQTGELGNSKVSVVSTTPLGNNKTLHVVELDGKRMLIGASANAIQLIKDLGSYSSDDFEDGEFSKIEIPNIRIPKIEIPKIEFPNIGFTKIVGKRSLKEKTQNDNIKEDVQEKEESEGFEISDIYEEGPDGIIDKLFQPSKEETTEPESEPETNIHQVNPDDFALYKKYL